jgi:hypothetical protein
VSGNESRRPCAALNRDWVLEPRAEIGCARKRVDRGVAQTFDCQLRELAVVAVQQRHVRKPREAIAMHSLRFGQRSHHTAERVIDLDRPEIGERCRDDGGGAETGPANPVLSLPAALRRRANLPGGARRPRRRVRVANPTSRTRRSRAANRNNSAERSRIKTVAVSTSTAALSNTSPVIASNFTGVGL